MTEQEIKDAVAGFLEAADFHVLQIPEREAPTPDLLATKDNQRFLIEIKTKEDDPGVLRARSDRLAAGEVVGSATPFTPQNTISRIIKRGARQLEAWPPETRDFCILWLIAVGSDSQGQYEQFRGTLYGLTNVVGPDNLPLIPSYYLRHSGFYRWRDILDGAVISTLEDGELCLNSHSPRYDELRASELATLLKEGLVDPVAQEQEGIAYVADCYLDRNDESAILQYLQTKYDRSALMPMNLGTQFAYVEIPMDE